METILTQNFIPILSIAGSDPSGGAGIQQDIKTCEAFGCYGMAAITALTAQSPRRVTDVFNTSQFLEDQLLTLLSDVSPLAVKIGMMPDAETVSIISEVISRFQLRNIIVDPVLVSTSGHDLTCDYTITIMKERLLRVCTVVTPNIPETEALTGRKIKSTDDAGSAAKEISLSYGSEAVLVKGGHAEYGTDILYVRSTDSYHHFQTERIITSNTHGTGCRLSTAIACGLAKGREIPTAVKEAKEWLTEELRKNKSKIFPIPYNTRNS